MQDRSLDMMVTVIFALSGVVILLLAGLLPLPLAERIAAGLFGTAGLGTGMVRVVMRRARARCRPVPVEASDEDAR